VGYNTDNLLGENMQSQTILIVRHQSLTVEEALALPRSFQAVMSAHPVIARADISLVAKEVVQLAVQAGRAVVDAEIVFHERQAPFAGSIISLDVYASSIATKIPSVNAINSGVVLDANVVKQMPSSSAGTSIVPGSSTSIFDRIEKSVQEDERQAKVVHHWWDIVRTGDTDTALAILEQKDRLNHDDQTNARELLKSEDPEHVVFICYAARHFQWKTWALTLRKLFQHSDPRVRKGAVAAVGDLAGPSLASSVLPLTTDPDAGVRRAADAAFKKLDR
jgi:hypothetical protein